MPIELLALLAAVGETVNLVKQSAEAVNGIISRRWAQNDEAKRKMEDSLAALRRNLADVGQLARVAEEYSRTHDDVLELLGLSARAETFIADNVGDLENRRSDAYAGGWKVLDTLFDALEANGDVARLVALDRTQWYSVKDEEQLKDRLRRYSSAYVEARAYIRTKSAREALHEVRDMTTALREVESGLRSTEQQILKTLQGLQSLSA